MARLRPFTLLFLLLVVAALVWNKSCSSPSERAAPQEQSLNPTSPHSLAEDLVPMQDQGTRLVVDLELKSPPAPSSPSKTQLHPKEEELEKAKSIQDLKPGHIRFRVYGKYALAGEDILLGEISPEDQKTLGGPLSLGQIPWSRGVELWPRGEVPFAISSQVPGKQVSQIYEAIEIFHQKTSIRFVDFKGDKDALHFVTDPERCASYVGKVGGHQPILLGPECGVTEITHELMHALGFIHEHQRDSRDRFVQVHTGQIEPNKLINFDILPQEYQAIYQRLSIDFDHQSLMLYPPYFFAKDPQTGVTLSSRDSQKPLAPSPSLSEGDILKLQEVYERNF